MADSTALARRFRVRINCGTSSVPDWQTLTGLNDLKPQVKGTMKDASDYENDGWTSTEKTQQTWSLEISFFRKRDEAGEFLPAQEKLRSTEDQFGQDARVDVQWYDKEGGAEAYQGTGLVEWERSASGVSDLEAIKVTISGDGPREIITNPLAVTIPIITAITPAAGAAAGGTLVTISGGNFTGTTGVTVGATAVTAFRVVNDTRLAVVMPAKVAGTYEVVVTNVSGPSVTVGAANDYTTA